MPGPINSPFTRSQLSPISGDGSDTSLPIIPNRTEMNPGMMRHVLQGAMGMGEGEGPEQPDEILAAIAGLFSKAGEYPQLQDDILIMCDQMKLARERAALMESQSLFQMPVPIDQLLQQQPPPMGSPMAPGPQDALQPLMPPPGPPLQ